MYLMSCRASMLIFTDILQYVPQLGVCMSLAQHSTQLYFIATPFILVLQIGGLQNMLLLVSGLISSNMCI
jgi:hypothetical protein